ncbi:hypothetical protein [Mesorhizobium sp. M1136]
MDAFSHELNPAALSEIAKVFLKRNRPDILSGGTLPEGDGDK